MLGVAEEGRAHNTEERAAQWFFNFGRLTGREGGDVVDLDCVLQQCPVTCIQPFQCAFCTIWHRWRPITYLIPNPNVLVVAVRVDPPFARRLSSKVVYYRSALSKRKVSVFLVETKSVLKGIKPINLQPGVVQLPLEPNQFFPNGGLVDSKPILMIDLRLLVWKSALSLYACRPHSTRRETSCRLSIWGY